MKQIPAHPNNYGIGRAGHKVDKIILHWIAGTLASCDATFQNPTRKASAHYGIGGDKLHQYVNESDTAWHAGNLTVNRQSIGIEHEGGPTIPISDKTYKTSSLLIRDICQRYGIPLDRKHIKGHNEISATQCPGTLDIDRLIKMAKTENAIINDMTTEEKNLLKIIKESNLNEGDIRWLADNISIKNNDTVKKLEEEIKGLKATISDQYKEMDKKNLEYGKLLEEFNILMAKYQALLESEASCQTECETAKFEKLSFREMFELLIKKLFKYDNTKIS